MSHLIDFIYPAEQYILQNDISCRTIYPAEQYILQNNISCRTIYFNGKLTDFK